MCVKSLAQSRSVRDVLLPGHPQVEKTQVEANRQASMRSLGQYAASHATQWRAHMMSYG